MRILKKLIFESLELLDDNKEYDDDDNKYYVRPKFKQFKEEILNYKHIDGDIISVYKTEILQKAQLFYDTKLAKSIVAPI